MSEVQGKLGVYSSKNEMLYYEAPIVLSHSTRNTNGACGRLYEFSARFNATFGSQDTYVADTGTALHEGVQEYVRSRSWPRAFMQFLMAFPHAGEMGVTTDGAPLSVNQLKSRSTRSFEMCYETLKNFINGFDWSRYDIAWFQLPDGSKKDGVEIAFAIKLLNTGLPIDVYYMGHIDLVLRDRLTGEYIIFDIKTTKREYPEVRYHFDQQTVSYGIVLSALTGQEMSAFQTHYLQGFIDLMKPDITDFPVYQTDETVKEFFIGLADDVALVRRNYMRRFWPRASHGTTCYAYNKPCGFAEFCESRDTSWLAEVLTRREDSDFYNPTKAHVQLEYDMKEFM